MKRARPFKTRLRNIFLAVAGAGTIGTGGLVTELLPKNADTDTQIVLNRGTPEQRGINISYLDQIWKQTLGLKSADSRAADMIDAAAAGDSWRVAAVLEHKPDLATDGVMALAAASLDGHRDVVAVLLKAGVPANGLDDLPFMTAMQSGQLSLALDYTDLAMPSMTHLEDAFVMAAGYGSLDVMERIMGLGVSADIRNNAALIVAATAGNDMTLERLFMETYTYKTYETEVVPAPPPFVDDFMNAPDMEEEWNGRFSDYLAYARHMDGFGPHGRYDRLVTHEIIHVRTLVDAKAQDNAALRMAALHGHVDAAKVLVKHGADIRDARVIVNAVQRGDAEMLSYILSEAPMMVDVNGGAPLYVAVQTGNVLMAQLLMDAGANPDAGDGRIRNAQQQGGNMHMKQILDSRKAPTQGKTFLPYRPSF